MLLNPTIDPAGELAQYIGEQIDWHDPAERFFFKVEFVQELCELQCAELSHPDHHMVVIPKHGGMGRTQRVWRHPLFMGWRDFAGLIRINLQIQTCAPARGFDCPSNTSLG